MGHPDSSHHSNDKGSASVELTLAMPLLILLLMLIAQFAMWSHATHIAQAAANVGVQAARAHGSTAHAGHEEATKILDHTAGSILANRTIHAERAADTATVTIEGTALAVIPGLSLPVRARVSAPREKVPGIP